MNEAKRLGAPVNYLVMADLMVLGYTENDAYIIAYPENVVLDAPRNKSIREKILSSAKFKQVMDKRMKKSEDSEIANFLSSTEELIDKKDTAKLILTAALKQPKDSKERIEGLMKYSDLMGYKKEDTAGDGTEAIEFFLPLKCNRCRLLKEYNENAAKPVRPVEAEKLLVD